MKIHLAYPSVEKVWPWEGAAYVEAVRRDFLESPNQRGHELSDDAATADLILFLEPNCWKDRPYAEILLSDSRLQRFPERCFAFNYADYFIGFLPGLYASLTRPFATDGRYAGWAYLFSSPNPLLLEYSLRAETHRPKMLFSFRGSDTAPVREAIFARSKEWAAWGAITRLDSGSFYDLSEEQHYNYAEEVLDSAFVLCPRGLGSATHRLFETMLSGRVPVILSDDWVPPQGPDWESFAILVPEREVGHLPQILEKRQADAVRMGRLARQAWEEWFAPPVRVPRCFDRLAELARHQPKLTPDYARIWHSWSFYKPYGLAPHQKAWKNLRQGKLLKKVSQRLGIVRR